MTDQISPAIESVLVVEDNFLIAMDMGEILSALGVKGVHIAATVEKAMEIVAAHPIDFAILDINLGDETSFTRGRVADRTGHPFRLYQRLRRFVGPARPPARYPADRETLQRGESQQSHSGRVPAGRS
ncbi:CheY-like chemotaxis protein [Sinorhizobium fredii]